MSQINVVTVFCSSSIRADGVFMDAARHLGTLLGEQDLSLVFGGGGVGLMGALFEGAVAAGAHTVGVTTKQFVDLEQALPNCDEMVVLDSMVERKQAMIKRGDAILVLPGGLGTHEEFFDAFVGRVLGHHVKPIGLINTIGALDPLLNLIEEGIRHKFISHGVRDYLHVHDNPKHTLEAILSHPEHKVDPGRMVPSGDWEDPR